MPLTKDQIEKMRAKRAKWDQRIAKAEGKLKQSERKHIHHQNFLIGAFVHDRLDHNAPLSFSDWEDLKKQIDKFLTRNYDRVAFELPLLSPAPKATVQTPVADYIKQKNDTVKV